MQPNKQQTAMLTPTTIYTALRGKRRAVSGSDGESESTAIGERVGDGVSPYSVESCACRECSDCSVGRCEGALVVAADMGDDDGETDGAAVNELEGGSAGTGDGAAFGDIEGDGVGDDVGDGVGEGVGEAVGSLVCSDSPDSDDSLLALARSRLRCAARSRGYAFE